MKTVRALLLNLIPPWCGIAAGLLAAYLSIVPFINLALGACFWEQGCEPNHNLKLAAVLAGTCVVSWLAGTITAKLVRRLIIQFSA
jgi:hypothetical protein